MIKKILATIAGVATAAGLILGGVALGQRSVDQAVAAEKDRSAEEITRLAAVHESNIASVNERLAQQERKLLSESEERLSELRSKHEADISKMRAAFADQLSEQRAMHATELDRVREQTREIAKSESSREFFSDQKQLELFATVLAIATQPDISKEIPAVYQDLVAEAVRAVPNRILLEARTKLPPNVRSEPEYACVNNGDTKLVKKNGYFSNCQTGTIISVPNFVVSGSRVVVAIEGEQIFIDRGGQARFAAGCTVVVPGISGPRGDFEAAIQVTC